MHQDYRVLQSPSLQLKLEAYVVYLNSFIGKVVTRVDTPCPFTDENHNKLN